MQIRKQLAILAPVILLGATAVEAGGDAEVGRAKAMLCVGCHGMDGNSTNPMWPKIAGQHEAYLAKQIRAFKAGVRKDPQMAPMVGVLSEEDIDNVAAYFASQKPK